MRSTIHPHCSWNAYIQSLHESLKKVFLPTIKLLAVWQKSAECQRRQPDAALRSTAQSTTDDAIHPWTAMFTCNHIGILMLCHFAFFLSHSYFPPLIVRQKQSTIVLISCDLHILLLKVLISEAHDSNIFFNFNISNLAQYKNDLSTYAVVETLSCWYNHPSGTIGMLTDRQSIWMAGTTSSDCSFWFCMCKA